MTGAAWAILASSVVFAVTWTFLLLRVRAEVAARALREPAPPRERPARVGDLAARRRRAPASHAPAWRTSCASGVTLSRS